MAFVDIDPRYQRFLEERGLVGCEALLALPAVIISGHPNRYTAQVALGTGPSAVRALLKLEHRVLWKDRLANAWAGFGLVSRSHREFRILQALPGLGVGGPEPIAAGEDDQGRAFVLVRERPGDLDLRAYLTRLDGRPGERRRFLRRLGEALARLHDAGFDHPDLYSKHVLVDPQTGAIRFLDWQRSRRQSWLGWARRWRDLAALHATLAGELATSRERLACLLAYLRASTQVKVPRSFVIRAVRHVQGFAGRLQVHRRVRELHQAPLKTGTQTLVRLHGEALSVTREFLQEFQGRVPDWLQPGAAPTGPVGTALVALADGRRARLVRRRGGQPLAWLWATIRRRHAPASPELRQAGMLFRLQRYGVPAPRLLAVGQRPVRLWRTESLLLTEEPAGAFSLAAWLSRHPGRSLDATELRQRRRWLREAGALLRRVHEAGYTLAAVHDRHFRVRPAQPADAPAVFLDSVEGMRRSRTAPAWRAARELAAMHKAYARVLGSRTDALRFFRAYLTRRCPTPATASPTQKVPA